MLSTQSQPLDAAPALFSAAKLAIAGNLAFASWQEGDEWLEISQASLSRALNNNCDGVVVLLLDRNGYEYARKLLTLPAVQEYVACDFFNVNQYLLPACILDDIRCQTTE